MSLLLWLPLTNNTENYGLADFGQPTFQNSTMAQDSSGKLGMCYKGVGLVYHTTAGYVGNKWTVAMWVKNSAWAENNDILLCLNVSTPNHCQIYFSIINGATLNLGINDASGVVSYSYTFNADEWYHVAATYDEMHYALYINGNQVKAGTSIRDPFYDCTNIGIGLRSNDANGTTQAGINAQKYMNDVRLYDHALSPREIKEISKGMVAHYTLSGWTKNYIDTSVPFTAASNGSTEVIEYGIKSLGLNKDTYFRFKLADTLESGKTYTMSFYASEMPEGSQLRFGIGSQNTTGDYYCGAADVKSGYNTITFVAPRNISGLVIMDDQNRVGNPAVEMTYFKIEEGDKATPWIPSTNDQAYESMGYSSDSTIEYDVSGNGYNGERQGVLYQNDSPRYSTSTYFDGTDDAIVIQNFNISSVINDKCTLSFWTKSTEENGERSVYFSAYSQVSWSIEKSAGNLVRSYWNGSPDYTFAGSTVLDDSWYHICIVKDGTNDISIYINGVFIARNTSSHAVKTFGTTWRIGRDTRTGATAYHGLISDFRLYSTAFSATDVLELYNAPIALSSNGVLFANEFQEVPNG